jgi:hypothetical protein
MKKNPDRISREHSEPSKSRTTDYHLAVFSFDRLVELIRSLPAWVGLHTVISKPGTSEYIVIVERIAELSPKQQEDLRNLGFAP